MCEKKTILLVFLSFLKLIRDYIGLDNALVLSPLAMLSRAVGFSRAGVFGLVSVGNGLGL